MSAPASRRGFLRGLAALPLVGGGVTLIGRPTAVAEPVTIDLLHSYDAWLHYERCSLKMEYEGAFRARDVSVWSLMADGRPYDLLPMACAGARFHMLEPSRSAVKRAALVLSAVGCDWREGAR